MIYVDDTIASSELAGVLVLVALAWALWASSWIARVEVHALAAPLVERLGLRWAREGVGARVLATGTGSDGRPVEIRFGRGVRPGSLTIWRRHPSAPGGASGAVGGAARKEPWQLVGVDDL